MFADIFTPTVTGISIIILAFFVWSLWKIAQVIDRHIKDLKAKVCSLEITCEEFKSRDNILQRQITYLQEWNDKTQSSLSSLEIKAIQFSQEIKKDSDNEIFEWSDDDFQDEDDETKE